MAIPQLTLGWAHLVRGASIDDDVAKFISAIDSQRDATYSACAYVCSDARLSLVRDILTEMGNIRTYSSAGNVIEVAQRKPSIVIAHGAKDKTGCGAVGYSHEHASEENPDLPAVANLVKGEAYANADAQLKEVDEDMRAGTIYFDHSRGEVVRGTRYPSNADFTASVFDELRRNLKYSSRQLKEMKKGQNPGIIFLTNLNTTLTGFTTFRVDMQQNEVAGIARDSVYYAVSHALKGEGSFTGSATTVMAFDRHNTPKDLETFLRKELFLKEYIERGGSIYLVSVIAPRTHEVYKITPR